MYIPRFLLVSLILMFYGQFDCGLQSYISGCGNNLLEYRTFGFNILLIIYLLCSIYQKLYCINLCMESNFIEVVLNRHKKAKDNQKSNELINQWLHSLLDLLFPHLSSKQEKTSDTIKKKIEELIQSLNSLLLNTSTQSDLQKRINTSKQFQSELSLLLNKFDGDLKSYSTQTHWTSGSIRAQYPEYLSVFKYRVSHWFFSKGYKDLAGLINSANQSKKIRIHEGSQIDTEFAIRGDNNISIAEGVKIGKNVTLYSGVTIGEWNKNCSHLIIEDDVTIYANATIIGQNIIIGKGSIIGSQAFISQSVLPNSKILSTPSSEIRTKNIKDLHSIQSLIGNTPLVEIKNIFNSPNVKIFAKLQGQNPGGSVKDRPAYNMIKQALKRGDIKPGMKLIEPTSGNTGIALAMIACVFNLDIQLVMPENSTAERVQTMQAYGAKVILTPAKTGIQGSRDYAQAKVAEGGYKMLNQFANPDNYMAHYHSTGPQIWRDTKGTVTHFVSSMGTTGTIMGTSMYLKQKSSDITIVGVQPTDGAKIPGIRRWTPDYLPKIFNRDRVDQIIDVNEEQSLEMMRRMAKQQAIFAGMSSGGAMAAAVKLAKRLQKGVIVTIVCDRGDRYLSSGIFSQESKP